MAGKGGMGRVKKGTGIRVSEEIGAEIAKRLRLKHISYMQFAEICERSPSTISHAINGTWTCSLHMRAKILEFLDIDVTEGREGEQL